MKFWISHPAVVNPVGPIRWARYHIGVWMHEVGRRWEDRAIDPDRKCDMCGENYWKFDHRKCDEIPF